MVGGVPLMDLISREGIPVVANDPARIQRFRGCALSLALVKKYKPRQDLSYDDSDQHNYGFLLPRQAEILILGRDMQAFCKGFANSNMAPPGSNNLVVSIRVAPVVEDIPGWRTDSLIAWFRSYGTQQYLLYPLQQYLRGMNDLRVFGKVFDDLHAAAAANMAQAQTREESIIYRATFANKRGNSFFERHKYPQACSIWRDAIVEIEDLRRSDEWNHFLEDEAKNVVGNLAKLYFAMHMNIAHAELQRSMVDPTMHYSSLAFANRALDKARKAMSSDFWGPELIWNAEPYHKAALLCKKATYLRLEGIELDKAMYYLEKALVYSPGDAEILWEQGEVSRLQEIELQDSQNTEA
ncbi:hypothetical protein SLS62_010379 [Diatrype stigma]|uniref:Uncharacterized protein n=1 Tax=Diatrype stigma TaxID=117547 RepID=A0AAN9YGL9_9PEZI